MSALVNGLAPNGKLMVIGAAFEPNRSCPVTADRAGSRSLQGWWSGTPTDSEDTLQFSDLTGVRAMIKTYTLEKAAEAYARMLSGDAQFRVALTM
jgi:D-arabinose 1-dehydrogenase-like Zn-dependent alcohol dehydrogenase